MKRRTFIQSTLASIALAPFVSPTPSRSIGEGQRFRLARIRHGGGWDVHPGAVSGFLREFAIRSSVDVAPEAPGLNLMDPAFVKHPMAVLLGNKHFSFSRDDQAVLKRWLEMGGFLVIDNAGRQEPSASFERAVREEFKAMFPRHNFTRVSPEHVMFRTFYRLDYPAGRAIHKPYVEGLTLGKRIAVLLVHNDLFGAFAPAGQRGYRFTPRPGGESQREIAMRFAVNISLYGLCLHYKDDQVHLDYLLHRRKWKVQRPR